MKLFMVLGGWFGFMIGLGCSWAGQDSWPTILWHASASAYLTGMLFRWWGRRWIIQWQLSAADQAAARRASPGPVHSTLPKP